MARRRLTHSLADGRLAVCLAMAGLLLLLWPLTQVWTSYRYRCWPGLARARRP